MNKPFNENPDKESVRAKIMGLGEKAGRKSYYPQLQARIQEAEESRLNLQKKSSDLLVTLNELESARQKSEENEKKFRTLFESITDGIMVADAQSLRLIMNNEAACKMLGCLGKCILDFHVSEIFPEDNTKAAMIAVKNIRDTGVSMMELPVKRLDGGIFFAEIRISRMDLDERECLMLIMRDITEHKKAREQLAHSRKMDAIGQLAGGIAHDFNNMLSGIIGASEMLSISLSDADELPKKLIGLIMEAAQSASDLTMKLLSFSRKTIASSSPLDIKDAITAATQLLERSIDKKIKIGLDFKSSNSNVMGDFTQLQNIFLNLGINAAHAMPDGGLLDYKTRDKYLDKSACDLLPFDLEPGRFIEIEVKDTGSGIPYENLEKIFDPFFTTKKDGKGTGLGLSAVYGTVVQHKGAITVSSKPGEGTLMTIYLPVSEQENNTLKPPPEAVRGSGVVMVVDDEEMIRATAEIFLSEMGYEVISADNGLKALDIFKTRKGDIDLVIMDMIMPEMSGYECFMAMKEIKPGITAIFTTGFAKDGDFEKLKTDGVYSVILKPYRYTELSGVVAEVLKKK